MPSTKTKAVGKRLLLYDVSWPEYLRVLRAFEERRLRITYDRGALEIMTLSHHHESEGYLLARLVDLLTFVLSIPVKGGGSTTFKKRRKRRGVEPAACWWIENEPKVRGKKKIDLRIDPAPDLCLEIEISRSCLDRLDIYARLQVPEIWRFDGKKLIFLQLSAEGAYDEASESLAFPKLKPDDLLPFLFMHNQLDETSVLQQFRDWVLNVYAKRSTANP